ncbi:MAG TPA: hypothetical protein DCQ30_04630, partial [Acidimicrobiaceae bacterium]|nr:hypothetical protein [Acidimicrobiaceae bacterium]
LCLESLRSREEMRRRLDDDAAWDALFETPLSELLERTFDSDLTRGTVLTDGLIGTFAPADDPELRQNRCFLYHVIGGSWDVPVGGMGALSAALTDAARNAGAELITRREVAGIATDGRTAEVSCADGAAYAARHVLAGVAPSVLARLLGETRPGDGMLPEGAQLKLNMLLSRLPRVPGATPEDAFTGTFHVNEGYEQLEQAYREALAGNIPTTPPCEVYCHSLTDPSILSPELRAAGVQTLTLFGLHTPARLFTGAVADRARSVYSGLIRIRHGARRADARQTNHNLVLSEGAHADSVPNLDIDENDVRCSHASTVGPIDEEQRYYLESRGIDPATAERLIVHGFFSDIAARSPFPEVGAWVSDAVQGRLVGRLPAETAGHPDDPDGTGPAPAGAARAGAGRG